MKLLATVIRTVSIALPLASLAFAQGPGISLLDPNTVPSGYPTFTMLVAGGGFFAGQPPVSGSIVRWKQGSGPELELPTLFEANDEVYATVASTLLTTPGTVSVRVENRTAGGGSTFSNVVTFTITQGLEITTPPVLPGGSTGVPYTLALQAIGGSLPYNWAIIEGNLPPGLTLQSNGGITGTPTTEGKYALQVGVFDAQESADDELFTIEIIKAPLTITSESPLPPARLNEFYVDILRASGGKPPYFWEVIGGELPPGMTMFFDGTFGGRPTSAGIFTFELRLTGQGGEILTKEFQLPVIGPLEIGTPSPLPEGSEDVPYQQALQANGGVPPYLWIITDGALPGGLVLEPDGLIRGAPATTGTFNFTVRAMDQREETAARRYTLVVGASVPPLSITTPARLPDATIDVTYNIALAATGGETPYTWSILEGELPAGLELDSSSGVISGRPVQEGEYGFQLLVSDAREATASLTFRLTVNRPPLVITTGSPLTDGAAGQAYRANFGASGGTPPYSWSQIEGNLPAGLTLTADGILAGTPANDGTFAFMVRAADSRERFVDKTFQLTIGPAILSITTGPFLPQATPGASYSTTVVATGGIPPYSWTLTIGGLPPGTTLSSGGEISGVPSAVGDFGFRLRVADSSGGNAEQNFAIRVVGPPLPDISVEGLPAETNPTDPQTLRVSISEEYPTDLNGTATLVFAPDATEPADDPAVQFSSGGRSVQFTIPAGSTAAVFGDEGGVGIQTGSVAGVITTTTTIGSGEGAVQDSRQMRVQRTAPSITIGANRIAGGFEVRVTGLSSPRDMTSARFQLQAAPGANLQTRELTVQLDELFGAWYRGEESQQYGSTFLYIQSFSIQGDSNAVNGVTVTLTNSTGVSEPATASF